MTIPPWVRPGVVVWYYPAGRDRERYLGQIVEAPRLLGGTDGTPVVRLGRMEHAYRREGVAAAAVWAIEPVGE